MTDKYKLLSLHKVSSHQTEINQIIPHQRELLAQTRCNTVKCMRACCLLSVYSPVNACDISCDPRDVESRVISKAVGTQPYGTITVSIPYEIMPFEFRA